MIVAKEVAIRLSKTSSSFESKPFLCTECKISFPSHDFWNNGDICDFCAKDYDYISWRIGQIKSEKVKKIFIHKKSKQKFKVIDSKSFNKFIKERGLKVVFNLWKKEQKTIKNSLVNAN